MLNQLDVSRARRSQQPYDWAGIRDVFEQQVYDRLLAKFPTEGFDLSEKDGRDPGSKSYRTYNLRVMDHGQRSAEFSSLDPVWQAAVVALTGPDNTQYLERLMDRSLSGTRVEVRFVVYSAGCWIGPHLDRADKRLTQILYLQSPEDRLVGGDLLILGSNDVDDVVERVPPAPNSSVVLIPSTNSWHAVSMLEEASSSPRRCVLIHFAEPPDAN